MKKKLILENLSKEFVIDKESFKLNLEIKSLSQNYFFVKSDTKNIEATYDIDETGSIRIYKNGKIFQCRYIEEFFENGLGKQSIQSKEILVNSPMPGLVSRVKVEAGQKVKKGDGLVVVEAMKMENEIKSPINGKVIKVEVEPGKAVEKNALLVVLKSE